MFADTVKYLAVGAVCLTAVGGVRADLPDVPAEAIAQLGTTYGEPQVHGFVFIDGRYIPTPYTVTRKGTAIFINRIQIEQPVSWAAVSGHIEEQPKKLDANGDFEVVAPAAAKPAEEPAAKSAEAPAAKPAEATPAAPKRVKSIDDLFDDTPAAAAPAPVAAPDAAAEPAAPAAVPAAAPAAPAAVAAAEPRSPEDIAKLKDDVRKNLDARRKTYELALSRGEIYFFGQRHSRLNGNYGTARTLIGVLPAALRNAQTPQELLQRLNEGGVYFVDMAVCNALFKNRLTFPLLEERLKKIEEDEALDAARRRMRTAW